MTDRHGESHTRGSRISAPLGSGERISAALDSIVESLARLMQTGLAHSGVVTPPFTADADRMPPQKRTQLMFDFCDSVRSLANTARERAIDAQDLVKAGDADCLLRGKSRKPVDDLAEFLIIVAEDLQALDGHAAKRNAGGIWHDIHRRLSKLSGEASAWLRKLSIATGTYGRAESFPRNVPSGELFWPIHQICADDKLKSRIRMAAGKGRRTKRVASRIEGGTTHYCVADILRHWPDDFPELQAKSRAATQPGASKRK